MESFFKKDVEFARCIIAKSGNFGKIQCEDMLSFEGCVFNGYFNMGEAYLKGETCFRRTEFFYDASFNKLLATGSLSFEKITFTAGADLSVFVAVFSTPNLM